MIFTVTTMSTGLAAAAPEIVAAVKRMLDGQLAPASANRPDLLLTVGERAHMC
jgi:hypothetical protein